MKQIIVLLVFMPCLVFGQIPTRNGGNITYRSIQLDLGPSADDCEIDAFALYQFDSIADTLYPGNRPYYFRSAWPSDLRVTLFLTKSDSSASEQLVVFDSLKASVRWFIPNSTPSDSIALFEQSAEESVLLVPLPVNSLEYLRQKPYLMLKCQEKTVYVPPSIPVICVTLGRLDIRDPRDFVFKNPWIAPDR